jgi:hypothetical protein
MTNQVITPPDLSPDSGGCLVINASQLEVELLARWLPIAVKDYTVYLYHHDMQEVNWLSQVADRVDTILISSQTTDLAPLHSVLDQYNKINWFGDDLKYQSPVEYFIKND